MRKVTPPPKGKLSNDCIQTHMHEIGLEAFLDQLHEVFCQAHDDTEDFEEKSIPAQYENACHDIQEMKERIFPIWKVGPGGLNG